MKNKKISKNISRYILICFSLLLTFWLITLFEMCSTLFSGKEISNLISFIGFKFLNHFLAILFIFILFFPLYYLLVRKKKKLARIIIKVLFVILVIIEFSLTKYSLTTLINLGADLLGYSLDDIYLTVTSSTDTSLLYFIPFVIFPILFLVSCFFLKKSKMFKFSGRIFIGVTLAVIIMKFTFSSFSEANYQNKTYFLTADIVKLKVEKSKIAAVKLEGNNEYPFLKPSEAIPDVLGPFFNIKEEKPNIVVVIVEGLGSEFVGDKAYSGFTPYINSLIPKSLYWDNYLCNTGRTFGALPTITGSLPFGEKGFLEIPNTPTHISLFSILKNNGYATSFFSGDQSSFDKKINYLEYNAVENIIDENKYDESYPKSVNPTSGFSWGYSDYEIFKKTLSSLDDMPSPRFDVIATTTIHEPFTFPVKEEYLVKVDNIINSSTKINVDKKKVTNNKDIFASILYADASVEMFIESYKKRSDFKNTIFIITGDHRLIPIAQKDKMCRFNVPFLIYSPLLKKTQTMKSISSHFDVAPSLSSFLSNNYNVTLPKETAWFGTGIDTAVSFRNTHKIPLMRYKGKINDFVYKNYLYSDGNLFKISENLSASKTSDKKVKEEISSLLNEFKSLNAYVTQNDKVYPKNKDAVIADRYKFTPEELEKIDSLTANLEGVGEMFLKAREKAFNGERETARLICNYILKQEPNFVDVRILKGRTLAWDGKYDEAEEAFLNALKRSPYYDDIYLALLDMYWWSSQNEKAEKIINKSIKNNVKSNDLAFKTARAYKTMKKTDKAKKIIDSVLKIQPNNKDFLKLKNSLK